MKQPVVGLVMKSLQAEFFRQMEEGARCFAQETPTFQLVAVGTDSQTEIERQITLVEQLISDRVDALVVVPIDSKALVPVIVKAVRAGIKVVNIDIRLDEELLKRAGIGLTYVGPDNYSASLEVARELTRILPAGSKVIMLEGLTVAENAQQRKDGFLKAIDEAGFELVGSTPADWETDKAESQFRNLFATNPDVEAVLCCNDAMALGVIRVLAEKKLTGMIPVVGFDNDPCMQEHLRCGTLLATVDAFGSQMAVEGIRMALKLLDGQENKGTFVTPYVIVKG